MMDIIDKLKKEKKGKSVFDTFIKKKKAAEKEQEEARKPSDIEVREIHPESPPPSVPVQETKMKPATTEFRTEGMQEFDMENLGESNKTNIKMEYKSKVSRLIAGGKIDEAIRLLLELKERLASKDEQQ
ncbi:hypothetical protein AMJ52_06985 [candidate division TA06 bacterium DG_78]|uniref:Uncharacterized protein n=1 Tax=candidate division TA06 bacterium DG_78 TaxID=1703772 RepID=A0A0S7YDG6_UNCT6|nr:MAG: hypothetical protein AMJ52_06985 [candidate division TA06 bacterium DG_78]